MTILPRDARDALKRWRRRPGLAAIATLVLALGIGATTAMFSLVHAALLAPEPWPAADRLVAIHAVLPAQRANPAYAARWNRMPISWSAWRDLQQSPAFDDVGVWVPDQRIVGDDRTELVPTSFASSTLLPLLGVQPAAGRLFTADEDAADSGAVIISHALWTRLLGARADAIGQPLTVTPPGGSGAIKDARRTIVGILPEPFQFPGTTPDVLLPIGYHAYNGSFDTNRFLRAIGRLTAATTVNAALGAAEPLVRREEPPDQRTARVVTLKEDRIGFDDRPLWLMLAGAGLLLLVACSNVAGLLLSDARTRRHETAVRLALGGTRLAILRQLLAEHGLLAALAGAGGVLLATWVVPALIAIAPPGLIGSQTVGVDRTIALWSIAAAVVTTLLAGMLPSFALSSTPPADALKSGTREATPGGRWRHRAVVAAQFALALVLLVGAGLFGETLLRLGRQPLGFSPDGVAVAAVAPARPQQRTTLTAAEKETFTRLRRSDTGALSLWLSQRDWVPLQAMLDRVARLPGVRAVAAAGAAPFVDATTGSMALRTEDQQAADAQPVLVYAVTEGFFDALGMPVRGRTFTAEDRLRPDMPLVISAGLERRLFGGDGVGRRLQSAKSTHDVIGVVADVKHRALAEQDQPAAYTLARSLRQASQILVRASGEAPPSLPLLRQTIESGDSPVFASSTTTLDTLIAGSIVVERGRAMLSGLYGVAALLLAAIGLYGLATRLVAERRREIGIRIALGAGRRDVRRLVMADAWTIVGVGLVIGVPAAVAASRVAQGLLFGVAPTAPHVLGIAALALAAAAVTATVVPAIRASRIDPAVTLRDE
jgi:putative ABC transport system permease protein